LFPLVSDGAIGIPFLKLSDLYGSRQGVYRIEAHAHENDPVRRRAAIDETFTEDCVSYDSSKGVYRGRDETDRVAGAIKAAHHYSGTFLKCGI